MMGQNCCCSSLECRVNGCQANKQPKPSPYAEAGLGGIVNGRILGPAPQYDAYANVAGAMNRLSAAIEAYNAIQKSKDPTK